MSPCCSSDICLPKRCSRLLPKVPNLPSSSCPKKGLNIFLVSLESSVKAALDTQWLKALVETLCHSVYVGTKAEKWLLTCRFSCLDITVMYSQQYINLKRDTGSLQEICSTNQNIFTGFLVLLFCMQMIKPAAVSSFPLYFQAVIENFSSISQR